MTGTGASLQAHTQYLWSGQTQAAVSQGTRSGILHNNHILQIETLFRLAGHFGTDPVEILFIDGHLQTADQLPQAQHAQPDKADQVRELLEGFHRVPDE